MGSDSSWSVINRVSIDITKDVRSVSRRMSDLHVDDANWILRVYAWISLEEN